MQSCHGEKKKSQINYVVHQMSHNCLHYMQLWIKVGFFCDFFLK